MSSAVHTGMHVLPISRSHYGITDLHGLFFHSDPCNFICYIRYYGSQQCTLHLLHLRRLIQTQFRCVSNIVRLPLIHVSYSPPYVIQFFKEE